MTKKAISKAIATVTLAAFTWIWVSATGCHESAPDWGARLVDSNDPIESFSITLGQTSFVLEDRAILNRLHAEMVKDDVPFEMLQKPNVSKWMEYCCVLSSGRKLTYTGTGYLIEGSIYLNIIYPEDLGFQGDPGIVVCLDQVLPENKHRQFANEIEKQKEQEKGPEREKGPGDR